MSVDTRHAPDERSIDRSVIRGIMKAVGNPRLSVRLWNGDEFSVTDARPVACMEFRERRAVFDDHRRHRGAHRLDPGRSMKPWLTTVTLNAFRDRVRRRSRRPAASARQVLKC